ncbi:TlyA family RNA methyltransferase [Luteolibacter yonseiensis]|uniref:TlyA family RNA methyltransferase n=1 Tax=Luteolibacter yonseiensis TaxID=1144680 RepID=A0A934R4W3_9BACT|nr:TlyA family RNA methyltransferase [Luteolibacter yonseiensis]MBK1817211.1 TlyA family RNA methyltransferase [Luteolibacter yonseiensis]
MKKDRIDALLVSRGLCDSREQAKRLILAGEVRSGDRIIDKPATKLPDDAPLEVKEKLRYVGRGGLKLEGALDAFGIDPAGWTCIDVGASTGGFTDCLLQRGAAKVHAVDVGTNQLVWKLRNDPRVIVKEQFNARHMVPSDIGDKCRLAVTDLSFISLTKVLPAIFSVLEGGGSVVCLIKPQFELRREDITKGGIVRDTLLHERAVQKIREFVTTEFSCDWHGVIPSPITGTDGNQEFLAWITIPQSGIAPVQVPPSEEV